MRGLTNAEFNWLSAIEEDAANGPCDSSGDGGHFDDEDPTLEALYQRRLVQEEPCPLHHPPHIGLTELGRLALHLARTVPETKG